MTYWGTLASGGQMLLGDPQEAVLSFDRDAPADQLKAVFPADRVWDELSEVAVYDQGQGVFRGIVDEQHTRLSASGLTVELVCRSREALLLDNEAEPKTITRPSLEGIRRRLLEPIGFTEVAGSAGSAPGELAVEKGTSCWQVLAGFCRTWLDTEPYVDFDGVLHCEGVEPKQLDLDGVMSAQISCLPYKRLSAVWKQGCRGGYDTLYSDPDSPVVRRRYISAQSGKNPRAVLEEAKKGSFRLTVTCAGAWWPLRGAVASAAVPGVGRFKDCPVVKGTYYRDGNGERTRLVLEKPQGGT